MQHTNKIDKHIEYLVKVNYQRMMAYDHAAFISADPILKSFYEARADESEHNLKDLYRCLAMSDVEGEDYAARNNKSANNYLSKIFNGRKTSMKILESVKVLEKTIIEWYKNVINEIRSLPKEIAELITGQYHLLEAATLKLAHL